MTIDVIHTDARAPRALKAGPPAAETRVDHTRTVVVRAREQPAAVERDAVGVIRVALEAAPPSVARVDLDDRPGRAR